MTIGQRLKTARERKEMTLDEVAKHCGTTKQTIFKYENGIVTNIPYDKIVLLSKALDVSPSHLFGWAENKKVPTDSGEHISDIPVKGDGNVIRIAGRDGSYHERKLTDEQMAALKAILDQMPDVPDDL